MQDSSENVESRQTAEILQNAAPIAPTDVAEVSTNTEASAESGLAPAGSSEAASPSEVGDMVPGSSIEPSAHISPVAVPDERLAASAIDEKLLSVASTNGILTSTEQSPVNEGAVPTEQTESTELPQRPTKLDLRKPLNASSLFFLKKTLAAIAASKDCKKNATLKDAVVKATELIESATTRPLPANAILEPLRIACRTRNDALIILALDCMSKLIASSFFNAPPTVVSTQTDEDTVVPAQRADEPRAPIMERVIDTICDCFDGEGTDVNIQLQVVKALLCAVSDENEETMLHQATLLKAIRQTYNIFLLSKSASTQSIAQGTLEQMINAVFSRTIVRNNFAQATPGMPPIVRRASSSSSLTPNSAIATPQKVTLDSFARRQSYDGIPDAAGETDVLLTHEEVLVKDAFLVFRSMCKLSTKNLAADSASDTTSHQVRSKLLSLHMICSILQRHIVIFTSPRSIIRSLAASEGTQFMQATKQYLCHALSRNAVSHIPQVFEVSCEIFWNILSSLRGPLKREIEVFMTEIYFPILEMKTSSFQQKFAFLEILARLCASPRVLVELYLNYDCDSTAMENIYERILNDLTRIASFSSQLTSAQQGQQERSQGESVALNVEDHRRTPSLSTRSKSITASANADIVAMPQDFRLAQLALRCISELLKSLVSWCEQGMAVAKDQQLNPHAETPERRSEDLLQSRIGSGRRLALSEDDSPSRQRAVEDDPTQFENLKHRKTAITDAIKLFNAKPKRGIAALQRQGLLKSTEPREIASFLLKTEGLNKATIGEYLGEGDAENISIMHNFVDQLDFQNKGFVEALRRFLQTFRLPGESQKIDRFMLKFADRYCQGNPEAFANADTAYVLAYSVIMLNTDAHNSNLAKGKKMTKAEFLRNNSGIDDGKDLDSGLLEAIFDEIQTNEIVLKEEQDAALMHGSPNGHQGFNLSTALATVGRDLQREAYVAASQEMASKSEARFRNLLRSQKRSKANGNAAIYYSASHFEHVGPMFEVVWMPLLASLSGPLQRSDDIEIVSACLGAFRHAIRIVCLFELDLARSAFVRTLAWFTSLSNLPEMRPKHVLGIRTLLEVATFEGSGLKDSWKEVLTCISQLERLQLISDGIEQDTMPEMSRISQARRSTDTLNTRSSFQANRSPRRPNNISRIVLQEVASGDLMVAVDRIFSQSATLSGTAIVHFVRALTAVSSEEIFSSAYTEQPRMYSLQKVVEISYYNMKRIRFEWSNIWQILGEHFNEAGCNANPTISFFAIDALRQLASRFLEIDELPHFKFQKDFLKPFEFIFARTSTTEVKEMILQCINQMVQARSENIKSGWQTMFGVFTYAATEESESSVAIAFENVKSICRERISVILSQGSFPNLVSCLTVFAKISKHQRISLHALDCLRSTEKTMLSNQNFSTSASSGSAVDEQLVRYWFPILYGFHDILMTGDDMEVRSRALQYLFEALTEHGNSFTPEFWDVVCRQLLFPIFFVLKPDKTGPKLGHIEDLSIWLSTTMVEALRNLVQLYTTFFQRLEHMLGGFLDLLSSCICQENDTLARIGSACLQQLIIENADRFSLEHWTKVTSTFEHLFRTTTAAQLFQQNRDSLSTPMDKLTPSNMSSSASLDGDASSPLADSASVTDTISGTAMEKSGHELVVPASKRREFKSLIVKCVLQLLLIEAVSELLNKNDRVFVAMPHQNMIVVLDLLRESWQFARRFNADKELRLSLWKAGFMKQLPNLLRQEVASASGYVSISLKLIIQPSAMETEQNRDSIIQRFLIISQQLLGDFSRLDSEAHSRNVNAWRPLIAELFGAYTALPVELFSRHLDVFYVYAVDIVGGLPIDGELQSSLEAFLKRVGEDVIFKRREDERQSTTAQ